MKYTFEASINIEGVIDFPLSQGINELVLSWVEKWCKELQMGAPSASEGFKINFLPGKVGVYSTLKQSYNESED